MREREIERYNSAYYVPHMPNNRFESQIQSTHHNDDGCLLDILANKCDPDEDADQQIRENCGQVTGVHQRVNYGNGAHRPVAAQVAGEQQQPQVLRHQIVVGELSRGRWRHRRRIIEPGSIERENKRPGLYSVAQDRNLIRDQ